MTLNTATIVNYKNIAEARLEFSPKLNCLIGNNGQGKTNVLDAIYMLSFTKSAYTTQDSLNITHDQEMAMVQGIYKPSALSRQPSAVSQVGPASDTMTVSCGLRRGVKKQFRRDRKDYKRLIDHIGLIPLVMVSPADHQLIEEGSDERRRFMDSVISQLDKQYLEHITRYSALLKQRNALLKQYQDAPEVAWDLFEVLEEQMIPSARYIFSAREQFISRFVPIFQELYDELSGGAEQVALIYQSQLHTRDLRAAYQSTRQRDLILGWTSQGVHKDELQMMLGDYPLKRVASQGQQKTYLLAMKLAQALYLRAVSHQPSAVSSQLSAFSRPILLLDDIFDKLDSERVARIVRMVKRPEFGQIFITDTDRQHLTDILRPDPEARIFCVADGQIQLLTT
jgi:DNA replication and repair protein RecF